MKWPVIVTAETTHPSGRRIRMRRVVNSGDEIESAMMRALQMRKDRGMWFSGEEITATTPLGQTVIRVLDPDTGNLIRK